MFDVWPANTCVKWKKTSRLCLDKIRLKAINRRGRKKKKYYHQIWPFINNAYGILYKIFTNEGQGEFECCDEIFEFNNVSGLNLALPQRLQEILDVHPDDCVSMVLKKNYETELVSSLNFLLSCSPISTIAFLCRGQSSEKEIVLGVISISDFIKMLYLGDAKTNVCYLVTSNIMTSEQ